MTVCEHHFASDSFDQINHFCDRSLSCKLETVTLLCVQQAFIVFTAGFLVWDIGDVQQTPVTPTHGAQVTTYQIPVFLTLMQKRGPADTRLTCSRTQSCRAQNQNPFCTFRLLVTCEYW